MGLTITIANAVIDQLVGIKRFDWLQASGVDKNFTTTGLNLTAMANYLNDYYGAPLIHITAQQYATISKLDQ